MSNDTSNPTAPKPGEIVLVLRPMPCNVPVAIRLRQLLKTALRRDRLRCVKVDGDALDDKPGDKQEETT
jgi:hypothetical protein